MRPVSAFLIAVVSGAVVTASACERPVRSREKGHQVIVHTLPDSTGRWIAIVDQVEYANGLLTTVADRVRVVEAASANAEGALVYSEDALPDSERPTVAWSGGRLLISVSRNATILHSAAQAGSIEIVVRPR